MRILVFGATGPSGKCLVEQALAAGHIVTAFARNPDKITTRHERLKIAKGDIQDAASIDAAMAGQEAVLSVLGVRKLGKNSILSEGTKSILESMKRNAIRRFICMTSLEVGDSKGQSPWYFRWIILPFLLRRVFEDKEIQERYIRESGLDWVIVRPAMLTNGPHTGVYQHWIGPEPKNVSHKISRADSVDFMLKQLTASEFLGKAAGLSY